MRGRVYFGDPFHSKFFFPELVSNLTVDFLYEEAYILVSKIGFSYSDVKCMSRVERAIYIKLYTEELKRINDAT